MSDAAEKLKPMLAALNADERAEVIEYLTSLEEEDGEWDSDFIDEINRRVADYEAGKTVGIPGEEVMRRLKEKYG